MTRRSGGTDHHSRWPKRLLAGGGLVLVGGLVGWAASAVFAPPADVLEETTSTFVTLTEGEVSSSISLNTLASWRTNPIGTNQASGTVTSIATEAGAEVNAGDVLYSVNLRPVVVAAGQVPAFRELGRGAVGADASQLQGLLAELAFYSGNVDGELGWESEEAIKRWQKSLGVEADGIVRPGDLMFVPALPSRVLLDTEILFRGATLMGGELALSGIAPDPVFTVPVTQAQAAKMPTGTKVVIHIADAEWHATVGGQQPSAAGNDQVDVSLQGDGDVPVCADDCTLLPIDGESLLKSEIITQAAVTGVVAPSAALLTRADGTINVIDAKGRSIPVTVVASARGMSVIEGAEAGLSVRIPASDEASG